MRETKTTVRWVVLSVIVTVVAAYMLISSRRPEVHARSLPRPNPTSYEYTASIQEVQQAIRAVFDGPGFGRPAECSYARYPTGLIVQEASELPEPLQRPENRHDFYADSLGPFAPSRIYYTSDGPADFLAEFHLHIDQLDDHRTRVQVNTIRPHVYSGMTAGWENIHGSVLIYEDVEPTTVEEYEILLAIGRALDERGMPALVVPVDTGPAQVE